MPNFNAELKPFLAPLSPNQRKFITALLENAVSGGWRGSQSATYNNPKIKGNRAKFYYWRKHSPEFLTAFRKVESFFVSRLEEDSVTETESAVNRIQKAIEHLEKHSPEAAEALTDALTASRTVQIGFKIGDDGKPYPIFDSEDDHQTRVKASDQILKRTLETDTVKIVKLLNPAMMAPALRQYWRENGIKSYRDIARMINMTGAIAE